MKIENPVQTNHKHHAKAFDLDIKSIRTNARKHVEEGAQNRFLSW